VQSVALEATLNFSAVTEVAVSSAFQIVFLVTTNSRNLGTFSKS